MDGKDFLREKVRKRNNHTCQICFKKWVVGTRRFDVHHIDIEFENNKTNYTQDKKLLDRMITLCHKCHLNLPHIREKFRKPREGNFKGNLIVYQNIKILREKRLTYKAIGELYGLTKQRIHQIYQKAIKLSQNSQV